MVFSPHDIRHLFITEFLILLRETCGAGTDHFDAERYGREREAFGSTIMGWRSAHTIDIYDHSRDTEQTLQVLAKMQHQLAQRSYLTPGGACPTDLPASVGSAGSIPNTEQGERNETVWFIEGDISKCFDALSHELLLSILRETIKDERFLRLISNLLKAGYLEDWRWNQTYSGTPQGSIVSPILANLYLDKLDKFVENVLIPEYTKGTRRKANKAYEKLMHRASDLARTGRKKEARAMRKQAQNLSSIDPYDPDYRRLRYCRYADDFLLGFVGPKEEAEKLNTA